MPPNNCLMVESCLIQHAGSRQAKQHRLFKEIIHSLIGCSRLGTSNSSTVSQVVGTLNFHAQMVTLHLQLSPLEKESVQQQLPSDSIGIDHPASVTCSPVAAEVSKYRMPWLAAKSSPSARLTARRPRSSLLAQSATQQLPRLARDLGGTRLIQMTQVTKESRVAMGIHGSAPPG